MGSAGFGYARPGPETQNVSPDNSCEVRFVSSLVSGDAKTRCDAARGRDVNHRDVTCTFASKRNKRQQRQSPLLNDELHRRAVSHAAVTASDPQAESARGCRCVGAYRQSG